MTFASKPAGMLTNCEMTKFLSREKFYSIQKYNCCNHDRANTRCPVIIEHSLDDVQLLLPRPREVVLIRIPDPAEDRQAYVSICYNIRTTASGKCGDQDQGTHHISSSIYCCCTCMISSSVGLSHCTTRIGCPTSKKNEYHLV